ncbi:hypothetical protein HRbin09_01521 [bacterium HR09]|nr:hypothetical protein HRbin09_01521 [bacterium HR09]
MAWAALGPPKSTVDLENTGVSGELRYLGWASPRALPPKAKSSPRKLRMGMVTRSRKRSHRRPCSPCTTNPAAFSTCSEKPWRWRCSKSSRQPGGAKPKPSSWACTNGMPRLSKKARGRSWETRERKNACAASKARLICWARSSRRLRSAVAAGSGTPNRLAKSSTASGNDRCWVSITKSKTLPPFRQPKQ